MKVGNKAKIEKAVEPKTEAELAQKFMNEYGALCKKFGYELVAYPSWKKSQETGDYRLVIQFSVGKIKGV